MLLLIRVGPAANYLTEVFPAVVVIGLGLSTTVAPLTAAALSTVPREHAGIASGVNNDVARTAGLLAVAVLPALAGISGLDYRIPHAFDTGFTHAALICAGLAAAAGILAGFTIRNPPRKTSPPAPDSLHVRPSCAGLDAAPLAAEG